jgi:hypothetical protein
MAFIFMDKISTSAHLPLTSSRRSEHTPESWRSTLVQPITVPDLSHTGIQSSFTFAGESVLLPDGAVSNLLRRHIASGFKDLPQNPLGGASDVNDMANRDKEKRQKKAKRIEKKLQMERSRRSLMSRQSAADDGSAFGDEGDDAYGFEESNEPSLNETQLSAMSKIIDKKPTSPSKRQKKPFSDDSLFTALLENQVGGNGDRWDLAATLND